MQWAIQTGSKGQHACPLAEQEVARFGHAGFTCTFAFLLLHLTHLAPNLHYTAPLQNPFGALLHVLALRRKSPLVLISRYTLTFKDLLFVVRNTSLPHLKTAPRTLPRNRFPSPRLPNQRLVTTCK
jgi:hypothetical protein